MRFGHMTRMKKLTATRTTLAAAFAAALAMSAPIALPAIAAAQTAPVALSGAERAEALSAVNRTLNGFQRLQGRFVQQAPDGTRTTGAFYLERPGKLRFEYDAPATLLIVSDGNVVAMRDTALRTTDRTPLRSTPLNILLGSNIDLSRDQRVSRVSRSGQWTLVSASDRSGEADGMITLHFWGPNAELKSWDVRDATGARTRITLTQVSEPASIDRRLFRLEDMLEQRPRRPT